MVFVIAEACVNFRDLIDADDLIRECANAGADAVKFQVFKEEHIKDHPRSDELRKIVLSEQDIRYLYWRCQNHGIEFMATPFYPEAVKMLNPYVKRWKIRCADHYDSDLINACMETEKETLLSCEDLPACVKLMRSNGARFLYCIPDYPPQTDYNIINKSKSFDGLSSHFTTWKNPWTTTVNNGFEYLEVHVRLDKYDPHWVPIDTHVSITVSDLKRLCGELK